MKLQPRDLDIIRCGALGMADKEIAYRLGLSANTVKVYMSRLRSRLGDFNRAHLPGIGIALGIVSVDEVCRVPRILLREMAAKTGAKKARESED